jgi:PAS domain S-box-containing protein
MYLYNNVSMVGGEERGSDLGETLERILEVAELLRNSDKHAPVGIVLKDAAGRVLWSNTALQEMLGYGEENLRGMSRTECIFSEQTTEDARLYEELLRGERDSLRLEKRYVTKDGSTKWGRLSIFRVEGQTDLLLVVVEDIEGRKEIDVRLREAGVRHRNVIESMGEGLLITDLEDHILYANPRTAEPSGYAAEGMLRRQAQELLVPRER